MDVIKSVLSKKSIPNRSTANNSGSILTAGRMGALQCHVKNGRLIESNSALEQPIINSLQTTGPSQLYTSARIKYPMVRKGYLKNPDSPQGIRGKDEFIRISWDEAYKLIHQQHSRIRNTYGPTAIFAGSEGWQSSGVLHQAKNLLQRYMNMAGGYTGHWGDYSTGAAQVIMPYIVGTSAVYQQQTTYPMILKHSDVVVLWGMNPLNTLKVAWSTADGENLEFYQHLKKSTKTIIVIDPIRTETFDFLNDNDASPTQQPKVQWVAPNPMTDVALMIGIAHTLVQKNLHDLNFINKYTTGYAEFEAYLLGKKDNIEKNAQWAEKITAVSAQQILALADLFHKNRTILMSGWGMQRQQYGEQRHWMLTVLAAMLGQIGLDGGGISYSFRHSKNINPAKPFALLPTISTEIQYKIGEEHHHFAQKVMAAFPVARIVEALEQPGQNYQHNGHTFTFPELKMIWWAGGANFTHHQDTNRLIKAWQKPELIVISEPYWTAAAKHADIVLPITTTFERNDLVMMKDGSRPKLIPMKQAVSPQYEARNDFDVFADLANFLQPNGRLIYTEGRDEMAWLDHFYTSAQSRLNKIDISLPAFDLFWRHNQLINIKPTQKTQQFTLFADFRFDPKRNPLKTPSGKIEIFSKTIESYQLPDCPPHPTWIAPDEWTGNAQDDQLQLITAHAAHRLHSQFNYAPLRDKYAIANREPITIHPEDAKIRGIKHGDLVRAYNKRGQILVGAQLSDGIKQGSVCIHQGAWFDPDPITGLCKNGNANVLTCDIPSSRLSNGCAANSSLIRVEKYVVTEKVPELTAFTPPQNS